MIMTDVRIQEKAQSIKDQLYLPSQAVTQVWEKIPEDKGGYELPLG